MIKNCQYIIRLLLLLIGLCANGFADDRIIMIANGATIPSEYQNIKTWYQFNIDNNHLNVKAISKLRSSDWLTAIENTNNTTASPIFKPEGYTVDVIASSLFSIAIISDSNKSLKLTEKTFTSFLPNPHIIKNNWQHNFTLGKNNYRVYSEYQYQENGALLNGSMTLKLIKNHNKPETILAPAEDTMYLRQELLWLGDVDNNAYPDLILKRTLITNEYEYVLVINSQHTAIRIDSDTPIKILSSGAEEESTSIQHRLETRHLTSQRFGLVAFSLNQESFNDKLSNARKIQLPSMIEDRLLNLNGEPLRITFEHIPRIKIPNAGLSSAIYNDWGGSVLIKTYFREQVSVIMEMGDLDGSFKLQADLVNNQPAIQIYYYPHYNNNLIKYWLWDEQQSRFKRWLIIQNQGC